MRPVRGLAVLAVALALCSCGGGSSDTSGANQPATNSDTGSDGGGGAVVDKQAPGHAIASVDGLEYSFELPGGLACKVTDEEFSFSYRIGENEVALGGGATASDGEWFGSMTLQIFADEGGIEYSAMLIENPSAIAIDGNSVSYSGPMEKYSPSNDGSPPVAEDVGDGTFSATCE